MRRVRRDAADHAPADAAALRRRLPVAAPRAGWSRSSPASRSPASCCCRAAASRASRCASLWLALVAGAAAADALLRRRRAHAGARADGRRAPARRARSAPATAMSRHTPRTPCATSDGDGAGRIPVGVKRGASAADYRINMPESAVNHRRFVPAQHAVGGQSAQRPSARSSTTLAEPRPPRGAAGARERKRRAEALRGHRADERARQMAAAGELAYLRAQLQLAARLTARLAATNDVQRSCDASSTSCTRRSRSISSRSNGWTPRTNAAARRRQRCARRGDGRVPARSSSRCTRASTAASRAPGASALIETRARTPTTCSATRRPTRARS